MWVLVTSKGQRIAVRQLPAVVGSSPAADVVIPHESVAERHARLSAGDDGELLVDAVDGAALELGGWQVAGAGLRPGDAITIGRIAFTVDRLDDGPPTSAAPETLARNAAPARESPAPKPAPATGKLPRPGTARAAASKGRPDELRQRQRGILVSAKPQRSGWVHTDLASLSGGSRLAVIAIVIAAAAGLLWVIQWTVSSSL